MVDFIPDMCTDHFWL